MFGGDQTYPALCAPVKYLVLCIPMLLAVLCACRALASHCILLLPGVSSACDMNSYMLLLKLYCAHCRDGWQCSYALCNMYQDGEERVGSHAGDVCCSCAVPLPVGLETNVLNQHSAYAGPKTRCCRHHDLAVSSAHQACVIYGAHLAQD